MKRREFLKTVVAGLSTSLLSQPLFAAAVKNKNQQKRNILFIAIDDLNDWVGCLGGHPQTQTPNLDKLASKGMLFSNAHCAAPACNPSRASLMTGIIPSTSGHYLNEQNWHKTSMLENSKRLSQHFRDNGYLAIGSGKIYHTEYPDPGVWDEYWPSKTVTKPEDPLPPSKNLNGLNKGHFDWGPMDADTTEMGDYKVADWVIGKLKSDFEKPVFLGCGFYKPHLPWYLPQKYFDKFPLDQIILPNVKEDDLNDVPPAGIKMSHPEGDHKAVVDTNQWKKAVQGYLAAINFMDEQLGRVIDAFDKRSDKDNWIVVLWSDHGWHLGEKLHWRKFALWEEATHNVLLCVAPGITTPGARCEQAVGLIDIYPTLNDICGLPQLPHLQGISLLPHLKDPKTQRTIPVLSTQGFANHSLRDSRWRYIRYADGGEELYDHDIDPNEWTNLAGKKEFEDVLKKMQKFLPTTDTKPQPPLGRGKKNKEE